MLKTRVIIDFTARDPMEALALGKNIHDTYQAQLENLKVKTTITDEHPPEPTQQPEEPEEQ